MITWILVLSYLGCTQECDPGYGMADGVCYELAKAGGTDGTGSGSTSSDTGVSGTGADGSGTGGSGTGGSGTGGAGAGGEGTGDPGDDGGGTGGTGGGGETSVRVSGTLQISGEVSASAVCSIAMWSTSDVDPTTGLPDRSSGATRDISNQLTSCPPDDTPLAFTIDLNLPTEESVHLYASVDQDGDQLTPEDRAEEGAASNPFNAEQGGELSDVAFTLTAPGGR